MKYLNAYFDEYGFIRQYQEGVMENYIDANFLNSNYWYLMDDNFMMYETFDCFKDNNKLIRYFKNFDYLHGVSESEYSRYTDSNTVSRDNSKGFICMAGRLGEHKWVRRFTLDCIKRGFFYQNKITNQGEKKLFADFCGPEDFATLIRASYNKSYLPLFLPLLLVTDLFFLLNIVIHVIRSFFQPTYCSTVFHTMSCLLQFNQTIHTPFSYIASKLFLFRRKPQGYEEYDVLEACLRRYSRAPYDPPIYNVCKHYNVKELL